jgi:hypothetical protein
MQCLHVGIYDVLIANDRTPSETADAWKYKVVAANSTWSVGYDTYAECHAAALEDVERG